jgi:hypothetical protein
VQNTAIPIKDRTPEEIRAGLDGQDDSVIKQFLALHAYAVQEHVGVTPLAQRTGIPGSAISQCFGGTYKGDYSAIAKRVETFFWRLEQKAQYGGIREFRETELSNALWAMFEKTRIIRRIQLVEGPEQVGKTHSATEYTARNNSGRTVMVSLAGGTQAGAQDFIWAMANALGIPYTIKLREKRLRIQQALESCDLLIIDEAHLMFTWSDRSLMEFLDYLRTDMFANGERGVVLMATNNRLLDGIQRFRRRAGYNIGQLLGRMRNEVFAIDPAQDIVEADVALLMSRYYKPGKAATAKIHAIATREQLGHFGLVTDIMNESYTRARARKRPLDDAIVIATAEEILATLKNRKDMYQ